MTTPVEPRHTSPATPGTPATPPRQPISLLEPSQKKRPSKPVKVYRLFCSVFRSFPILTPTSCKLIPVSIPGGSSGHHDGGRIHGATRMTGTLFGHRKARVTLSIQESPRCLPIFLLELPIPTAKLLQEMGSSIVRVALECEKRAGGKIKLVEEPIWTVYSNGRKMGYGAKRDPTDADLRIMELLRAVSMGAGVLPGETPDLPDRELTYMRAHFDRVIGSKDSETLYMLNPDRNSGPELSIFFVRI